jgi:hypothetical protein
VNNKNNGLTKWSDIFYWRWKLQQK